MAVALQDPPVYHLEDMSTNGTTVNGVRLTKKKPQALAEGDIIRLAAQTVDPTKIVE
jgi:pSer/pThr/pTyr-binding forkhead associated (FHA) protein